MTARVVEHDLALVACAISAGIHVALAPEHFGESTRLGAGFVAAAALLAANVLGLTLRPTSAFPPLVAALLLGGLLLAYLLMATSGLPLLHPQPEPVDALALGTKGVELIGLVAACRLVWHVVPRRSTLRLKGTLT